MDDFEIPLDAFVTTPATTTTLTTTATTTSTATLVTRLMRISASSTVAVQVHDKSLKVTFAHPQLGQLVSED